MTAFYNDIDSFCCEWTRELIKAGVIPDGVVDERSIWDVIPGELGSFQQAHFCNGISTWAYVLKRCGFPIDRTVWTASLPCQPFSVAGKGGGLDDSRNLAEPFLWLVSQCRPDIIFGEQVEAAIKHDWWDVMATSLEQQGYAVGAVAFPASAVGAFHQRQRLYWLAYSERRAREQHRQQVGEAAGTREAEAPKWKRIRNQPGNGVPACGVADADGSERRQRKPTGKHAEVSTSLRSFMGDTEPTRFQKQRGHGRVSSSQDGAVQGEAVERTDTPTGNFWSDAVWIPCRDGKWRPAQSEIFPLAYGHSPARVGILRGAGNAICAPQAEAFVRACMDVFGML